MSNQNSVTELSAVEQKLLHQVQSHAKPRASWVKFLANTIFGFYW